MEFTAIETKAYGYRFRSRLEARWAVFFTELGLNWEYEKEGFVLPSGRHYLPDFWIEGLGWFEIKPYQNVGYTEGTVEIEFFGSEAKNGGGAILYGDPCRYDSDTGYDGSYLFCECRACNNIGFEFNGRSERIDHKENCPCANDHKNYDSDTPRIIAAAEKARSARFEHGESPS